MPKPKEKDNKNNDEIKINKQNKSSIAEFTKRPLPTDRELENFEEFISSSEDKREEIEESLSEIYQDDNGDVVDVKKLEIKKQRGFFFWFFMVILIASSLAGAVYAAYYYYVLPSSDSQAVQFFIEAKKEVMAGEEFFYTINYKNLESVDINNIEIKLVYPENFVFLDSEPVASKRNDTWHFNSIAVHRSGKIKIKGKIIGQPQETNIILADMIYTPANFSSEFKKSASFENIINDTGIEFTFINATSVLVGDENEIIVKYKASKENYLNNFRLIVEPFLEQSLEQVENIEFISSTDQEKPGVWQINEVDREEKEIKIKFKFTDKIANNQDIVLKFEHLVVTEAANDTESETKKEYYLFKEKIISFEVIKSDLNLNLIINGTQTDQGIDFSQALNYTIVYANKGQTEMKDVVIMAVLESEFLDWTSLADKNNGKVKNNTISWSKEEIPVLESLNKNDEGTIDFSIKIKPQGEIDLSKDYQVKSYAQYSIGDTEEAGSTEQEQSLLGAREDMRSNTIINKINSDLKLNEQIRYFNDDNIAVGSGPLPPKVGETTSYKVYWVLTNNLHELNDLQVLVSLPDYVKWDNKNRASVGNIQYDNETGKVIWQIGRLPTTVYRADAEFNISITPTAADKNKILVLLPGTITQAIDSETKASINKTANAKTTKLEDDEIANSDGRVME